MVDLGVGGVRIGEQQIVPEPERTGRITMDNCIIQSGGRILPHTVAVWIGHSADNAVTHGDISDICYTAVSVGGRWGYAESVTKRNKIEFNHLHHLGYRILSDMNPCQTGPSVQFRDQAVHSRGKKLADVPNNHWMSVEMRAPLGRAESRWELTLTLPGGVPPQFKDLSCDPRWKEARWVGFSSLSPGRVAFYLDDVVMENQTVSSAKQPMAGWRKLSAQVNP